MRATHTGVSSSHLCEVGERGVKCEWEEGSNKGEKRGERRRFQRVERWANGRAHAPPGHANVVQGNVEVRFGKLGIRLQQV